MEVRRLHKLRVVIAHADQIRCGLSASSYPTICSRGQLGCQCRSDSRSKLHGRHQEAVSMVSAAEGRGDVLRRC